MRALQIFLHCSETKTSLNLIVLQFLNIDGRLSDSTLYYDIKNEFVCALYNEIQQNIDWQTCTVIMVTTMCWYVIVCVCIR